MATNVDKAWESMTLAQLSEMLRLAQIQGSHINKNTIQLFIEGKNPFEKKENVATIPLPAGTITKAVRVNRTRSNMGAINATGRAKYLNYTVVAEMLTSLEEEMEIHFIPLKKQLSVSDLEKEVDALGLKLVDPIALCAANEEDPAFADKHPNGTQWRDKNGRACCAIFNRDNWGGRRDVGVYQSGSDWSGDDWFFACVRK